MENMDLRKAIENRDVSFDEIANELGITIEQFNCMMDKELELDDFNMIVDAVNEIWSRRFEEEDQDG